VNEIHLTSADAPCVVAVNLLPGGTSEDYWQHIASTVDCLAETYASFHQANYHETRRVTITYTTNTMSDRANVNKATVRKLEEWWETNIVQLNCMESFGKHIKCLNCDRVTTSGVHRSERLSFKKICWQWRDIISGSRGWVGSHLFPKSLILPGISYPIAPDLLGFRLSKDPRVIEQTSTSPQSGN
jgi:hypothetical protein